MWTACKGCSQNSEKSENAKGWAEPEWDPAAWEELDVDEREPR